MISGEVVYPKFDDSIHEVGQVSTVIRSQNSDVRLRIYGCDYKLSKSDIRGWIEIFVKIQEYLEEEAGIDKTDGSSIGTGTYIAKVKLLKRVLTILPQFGQKVIIKYDGYSKICKTCYQYHKEVDCVQRSWREYVVQFKDENPGVPQDWYDDHDESKDETLEDDLERGLNISKDYNLLPNESGTLEDEQG